jgi:hypothetical protein
MFSATMFLKKLLAKCPLVVVWLFIALENVSALIESPSEDECPVSQPYNKIFLFTAIVEIPCYISIYVDEVTILNINDVYITINNAPTLLVSNTIATSTSTALYILL